MADVLYPSKALLDAFLKTLLEDVALSLKAKGYIAPTVFFQSGKTISEPGWAYYKSLNDAFLKLKYLFKDPAGQNIRPEGSIPIAKNKTAQTIGYNADFYFAVNPASVVSLGYKAIKFSVTQSANIYAIFSFYKQNGSGPYYAIFDPKYLGAAAMPVTSLSADKISAIDKFTREALVLKARHNTLVDYIGTLAQKPQTPALKKVLTESVSKLQAMRAGIQSIEGIKVYYSNDGRIGNPLGLGYLGWIVIGGVLAAWAVPKIIEQFEKTKRLNASFDVQKFVIDNNAFLAQEYKAGRISKAEYDQLIAINQQALDAAIKAAATAVAPSKSMFGEVGDIVKWVAIGLGVFALSGAIGKSSNKKSS